MRWLAFLRPGDWLVIAGGAALVGVTLPLLWQGGFAERAIIRQDGQVFAEVDLGNRRDFAVPGPLGTTLHRHRAGPRPRRRRPRPAPVLRAPGLAGAPRRDRHLRPQSRQRADRRAHQAPMTASVTELTVTAEDRRVAWLATAAVALSLVDAAIPSPLPGVKPGLANIVTLVVLVRYGWATAVWVSGLRVLAGSLLLGYFLAPGFFLSLTGTTLSLATLGLARHLPARWFGPVSLSILAAFAHIGGQLLLARVWLIPHNGVFLLTPVFAAAALVFGTINGLIAAKLLAEPSAAETSQ